MKKFDVSLFAKGAKRLKLLRDAAFIPALHLPCGPQFGFGFALVEDTEEKAAIQLWSSGFQFFETNAEVTAQIAAPHGKKHIWMLRAVGAITSVDPRCFVGNAEEKKVEAFTEADHKVLQAAVGEIFKHEVLHLYADRAIYVDTMQANTDDPGVEVCQFTVSVEVPQEVWRETFAIWSHHMTAAVAWHQAQGGEMLVDATIEHTDISPNRVLN